MRGYIVQERNGTWTACWSTSDPATGGRRQHKKRGFTRKEPARPLAKGDSAREFLNTVVGQVQEGRWRPDKRLTVRELLEDHWLPAQRARGLKETTVVYYETAVNTWLLPHIGGVVAATLTPKMMVDLAETLRVTKSSQGRAGLSQSTVHVAMRTLKSAFAWAVANDLVARSPIAAVKFSKGRSDAAAAWTAEQSRAFLDATSDERLAWAWALLLARGPRRGEVAGMRWEDVDFEARVWHVSRNRVYVNGRVTESTPKTARSRRSVPLDDLLLARLRAHKARQAAERLAAGGAYDERGYLFADELGVPYFPQSLTTWFLRRVHKVGAELGLPRIRLHDTRHTAATLMLADGVPVKVVQEILGHSSPSITLDMYGHLLPGMAEAAGAALSARLLGTPSTSAAVLLPAASIVELPERPASV